MVPLPPGATRTNHLGQTFHCSDLPDSESRYIKTSAANFLSHAPRHRVELMVPQTVPSVRVHIRWRKQRV